MPSSPSKYSLPAPRRQDAARLTRVARRRCFTWACALMLLAAPSWSAAQDDAAPPTEDATSEDEATPTTTPAAPTPSAPTLPAPRPPLPVMVAVLVTGRVPDDAVTAASGALVDTLTPLAGRRPVLALQSPELLATFGACRDDACFGAALASAQAQAGAFLSVRRARGGLGATLVLRDPVSGTVRHEEVSGTLPASAEGMNEAITALVNDAVRAAMPSPPPPPPSLLVTVNVDGARVSIDGVEIGASPVAPVEIAEGEHTVQILMPGYVSVRRQTEVTPGEQARVDITLRELGAAIAAGEPVGAGEPNPWARPAEQEELIDQWWFWTAIGGGAALLIGIAIGVGVAVSGSGESTVQPTGIRLPPIMGGM